MLGPPIYLRVLQFFIQFYHPLLKLDKVAQAPHQIDCMPLYRCTLVHVPCDVSATLDPPNKCSQHAGSEYILIPST